jgi:hypothetical protein
MREKCSKWCTHLIMTAQVWVMISPWPPFYVGPCVLGFGSSIGFDSTILEMINLLFVYIHFQLYVATSNTLGRFRIYSQEGSKKRWLFSYVHFLSHSDQLFWPRPMLIPISCRTLIDPLPLCAHVLSWMVGFWFSPAFQLHLTCNWQANREVEHLVRFLAYGFLVGFSWMFNRWKPKTSVWPWENSRQMANMWIFTYIHYHGGQMSLHWLSRPSCGSHPKDPGFQVLTDFWTGNASGSIFGERCPLRQGRKAERLRAAVEWCKVIQVGWLVLYVLCQDFKLHKWSFISKGAIRWHDVQ